MSLRPGGLQIPTLASCSFDEIRDAAQPGQPQWMQLYVNRDREITKKIVQHAEKRGVSGLFMYVMSLAEAPFVPTHTLLAALLTHLSSAEEKRTLE